jgi:hypothetical protein
VATRRQVRLQTLPGNCYRGRLADDHTLKIGTPQ